MYFFVTGTKPQLPFQTEHIILYYVKNGARAPAPLHQNIGFSTTKKSKAFEKKLWCKHLYALHTVRQESCRSFWNRCPDFVCFTHSQCRFCVGDLHPIPLYRLSPTVFRMPIFNCRQYYASFFIICQVFFLQKAPFALTKGAFAFSFGDYSISPLSLSRISMSVPFTFFITTLSSSFSLKESLTSVMGFLSMA